MNGSFTWKILDDRDVHRLQMFLRPDSGEQQQLRRIYGTTGDDYLLCGAGNSKFTTLKMRSLKLTSPNSPSRFGARTWFRALSAGNRSGKKQSFPRESAISLYCWLGLFLFTFCKIQFTMKMLNQIQPLAIAWLLYVLRDLSVREIHESQV